METSGKIYISVTTPSKDGSDFFPALRELISLCGELATELLRGENHKPQFSFSSPPLLIGISVGKKAASHMSKLLSDMEGNVFRSSRHGTGKVGAVMSRLQRFAVNHRVELEVSTSESEAKILLTRVYASGGRKQWVNAELYVRGIVTSAGGRNHAFVKLDNGKQQQLRINAKQEQLDKLEHNPLYKECTLRVTTKMNAYTNSVDTDNMSIVEFVEFNKSINQQALAESIEQATTLWNGSEPCHDLKQLRGGKYGI